MGKAKGSMCVRLLFSEGRAQQKSILASLIILRKLINQKFELVSQTCFQTYLLCCLLCIFWHKLNLAPAGRKCPGPRQKLVWKWHRVANEVYHRHNCRTWNDNSQDRSIYLQGFNASSFYRSQNSLCCAKIFVSEQNLLSQTFCVRSKDDLH